MSADERNKFCEKYRLDVQWSVTDRDWFVTMGEEPFGMLSESLDRDTAIDLAADRLAERGLL